MRYTKTHKEETRQKLLDSSPAIVPATRTRPTTMSPSACATTSAASMQ